ncbi:hypothetical protein RFI_25458 [Reticulomyxa filosa]|uniref:Uncharacterized protein n=1 Tax=Reticulomyxa filosa TaxID=46433 RepID=X6MEU4_RETFI|nr:hypothetical protein RFI_25458 [Reticulomyxa filosa]|eukprot:ETO11917.1 hypothetical protein RFI_25458 [Reticulomyxa filosa]
MWGYPGTDDNYAYFIIDNSTEKAMVVDPAGDKQKIYYMAFCLLQLFFFEKRKAMKILMHFSNCDCCVTCAVHKPPVMEAWQRLKKKYIKLEMCGVLTTHKHKRFLTSKFTVGFFGQILLKKTSESLPLSDSLLFYTVCLCYFSKQEESTIILYLILEKKMFSPIP